MGDYRTLFAYQKAFTLSMKLFNRSKKFPPEEKFGLMVQIRNSSRSVCVNIVEAYKRRRYKEFKYENDEVAKLVLYMINNPEKFR